MRIFHIKKLGPDDVIRDKMYGAALNKQPGWVYIVDEMTRAVVGFNLRLLDSFQDAKESDLRDEFLQYFLEAPATMQILYSTLGVIRSARLFGAVVYSDDCKIAGGPDKRVAFFMGQRKVLHLPALADNILSDGATPGFFARVRALSGLFSESFQATSHVLLCWNISCSHDGIHGSGPLCKKVFPAERIQKKLTDEPMILKVWRASDEKQALSLTTKLVRGEYKKNHILAWVRRGMQRFCRILDCQILATSFAVDLREILYVNHGRQRGRDRIPYALMDVQVLGIIFGFL